LAKWEKNPETLITVPKHLFCCPRNTYWCPEIYFQCPETFFDAHMVFPQHIFSAQKHFSVSKHLFHSGMRKFLPPSILGMPVCRDYVNDGDRQLYNRVGHQVAD
jgi:hypothetical protein